MKPNCYECKHRREIPGDAHSSCSHPLLREKDKSLAVLMLGLGKQSYAARELGIVGHPTGIKGNYFLWPINFDPIWLEACNGFELIQKDQHEKAT